MNKGRTILKGIRNLFQEEDEHFFRHGFRDLWLLSLGLNVIQDVLERETPWDEARRSREGDEK